MDLHQDRRSAVLKRYIMADAIIFDVDGTLLDSVDFHARSWQETFTKYGIDVTFEEVRAQIGKGADQLMPVFVPEKILERAGDEIRGARAKHFTETYLPRVRAFPRVRDLFLRLKDDGKRVVLASSASADEIEAYKKIAGITDLIESDTCSDDAERSKPYPDIFVAALGKLGDTDVSKVVVVGDTPYDAEAAGKAGLRTVGVLCGGFTASALRAAGCVALYRDPADLLANYDRSPLA